MAWRVLQLLHNRMKHAALHVKSGNLPGAANHYNNVWDLYEMCQILHFEESSYHSDLAEPVAMLYNLVIVAAIMESILSIKLDDFNHSSGSHRNAVINQAIEKASKLPNLLNPTQTYRLHMPPGTFSSIASWPHGIWTVYAWLPADSPILKMLTRTAIILYFSAISRRIMHWYSRVSITLR